MSVEGSIWETLFDRADEDGRENSLLNKISKVEHRYENLELAGVGAMKRVFRTVDKVSDRVIAKAVLKDPDNDQAVESFLREARIIAMLQHPNIVPLYDMGVDESGIPFFTMRLVGDLTLRDIIVKLQNKEPSFVEKYTLTKRVDIFLKVCEAMAYAHSEGIAHLDLKPDNITVSRFGKTLVCDWGLAAIIGGSEKKFESSLLESFDFYSKRYYTLSGEIKGTPGYMSPEQAKGNEEPKDERSDIFALGCIFYELLSLERAFEGESVKDVIYKTVQDEIESPNERSTDLFIPDSLNAVCMKAIRKHPDDRYQKVEEIIADIDAYRQGFLTEAEDYSFKKQIVLIYKRNKQIFHLALIFVAIIIIGSLYFVDSLRKEKEVTSDALKHSEYLREKNEKISVQASENYALKARTAYYRFQMVPATDLLEASLALDSNNALAISYLAKILLIQQRYEESYEKSLELFKLNDAKRNAWKEQDLRDFTQKMLADKNEYKDIKLIYPSVQEFLQIDNRFVLVAQLYAWTILKKQTFVDDKLKEIESDIRWLLSQENNKPVKCKLTSEVGGFALDLSGNGELPDIRSIGQLPLIKLDLRGTKVKHMSFVKPGVINLLGLDSFRKTKVLWVDKNQEIPVDSFRRATIRFH